MSVPEGRAVPLSFGRYKDPVLLGAGGMGAVYRAIDPQLDRFVAVKVLTHREPKYVERFRREAQVLAKIMHPSIIQIYEIVGSDDDNADDPYIVMEYFEAKPLDAMLKSGPLSQRDVVEVILRTAEGLKKAHANAVIHRDIKPANLMMSDSGEVKILDFGIAKALDAKNDLTGQTVLGTPYYMSPEQAMGQTIDGRTDIYSLGITSFHLLAGRRPFEAKSKVDVMLMQVKNALPDIRQLVTGADERVVHLIEKMCSKAKEKRYQSCQELIEAVEALPSNLGGRAPADHSITEPNGKKPVSAKFVPTSAPTLAQLKAPVSPQPARAPTTPGKPAPRPNTVPMRASSAGMNAPAVSARVAPIAPHTPGRTPRPMSQTPQQTPARPSMRSNQGTPRPDFRQAPPPQVPKASRSWVGVVFGALGALAIAGAMFGYLAFAKPAKTPWRPPLKGWAYPGPPAPPLKKMQAQGAYSNCIFSTKPLEAGKEDASSLRNTFSSGEEMSARCYLAHQLGPNKAGEIYQELWIDGQRRKQVIYDPPLANDTDQVAVDVKQTYGTLLGELSVGKHTLDLWLYRQGEDADNPEPLSAGELVVRK